MPFRECGDIRYSPADGYYIITIEHDLWNDEYLIPKLEMDIVLDGKEYIKLSRVMKYQTAFQDERQELIESGYAHLSLNKRSLILEPRTECAIRYSTPIHAIKRISANHNLTGPISEIIPTNHTKPTPTDQIITMIDEALGDNE